VFVDGLNASDFGDYINFVTVQIRKNHQSGDQTFDETRIDRNNFSAEGNAFKLLYGWKGDDNRNRWMNYDYRTMWSFHGGHTIEGKWASANFGALGLSPSLTRRQLHIEADPDALSEAGVRAATVKVYYTVGDDERVQQVTIRPTRGELSRVVDYLTPADSYEYDYEITWLRRGEPNLHSGRQSGTDSILFVDELPEA